MDCIQSDDSIVDTRVIDFKSIPVDTVAEKFVYVENNTDVSMRETHTNTPKKRSPDVGTRYTYLQEKI